MIHRAAIYARFSTDRQNEKSTDDQLALCRVFADRQGMEVVGEFFDKAKSGASMHNRDGLLKMIDFAMGGGCDVIVVEALDRLSRDIEDMSGMFKRLQYMGVRLIEVHGGEANTLTVGMKAIFAQMFREENVHKIRRGMAGLVKRGRSAGGRSYGYRADPALTGSLIIVDEEAEVVRRIFRLYADGCSPRDIAYLLNQEGVPSPRGGKWNASTINGSRQRGNGILRNSLYVGQRVWNRVRMTKNPDTGRRVSRPNALDEREGAPVPECRIVSDDLFERVQMMKKVCEEEPAGRQQRPRRLLSGLLRCGACGSGMSTAGKDRSGRTRICCSAHKESRSCRDPKTFYLDAVEEVVEPPRDCRRHFGLSHAAMGWASSIA